MLRKNELVSVVKQILYEYGPEAYLMDSGAAEEVVQTVLRMQQSGERTSEDH